MQAYRRGIREAFSIAMDDRNAKLAAFDGLPATGTVFEFNYFILQYGTKPAATPPTEPTARP